MRKFIALIAAVALLTPLSLRGQSKGGVKVFRGGASRRCSLKGTWRLEALFVNGKPEPFGSPHLKIVNATHFIVVEQLSDSVPSETDSTRNVARPGALSLGVAGRYSLIGDDYVEHVEVAPARQWIGLDFHAKCEVVGNLWYHRFTFPGTTRRFEEHYRRISP